MFFNKRKPRHKRQEFKIDIDEEIYEILHELGHLNGFVVEVNKDNTISLYNTNENKYVKFEDSFSLSNKRCLYTTSEIAYFYLKIQDQLRKQKLQI